MWLCHRNISNVQVPSECSFHGKVRQPHVLPNIYCLYLLKGQAIFLANHNNRSALATGWTTEDSRQTAVELTIATRISIMTSEEVKSVLSHVVTYHIHSNSGSHVGQTWLTAGKQRSMHASCLQLLGRSHPSDLEKPIAFQHDRIVCVC